MLKYLGSSDQQRNHFPRGGLKRRVFPDEQNEKRQKKLNTFVSYSNCIKFKGAFIVSVSTRGQRRSR